MNVTTLDATIPRTAPSFPCSRQELPQALAQAYGCSIPQTTLNRYLKALFGRKGDRLPQYDHSHARAIIARRIAMIQRQRQRLETAEQGLRISA